MDIATGLTAATEAINIAKSLRNLEKSFDAVAHKARIVELMDALVDAKTALTEAKAIIDERDRQIASLRAAFDERAALVIGDGDYKFKTDESGNKVGYPVCPKCEAASGKIVQLKQDGHHHNGKCPVCDSLFSPVTCYLPVAEVAGGLDTVAKRAAENHRRAIERAAERNRQSSWIDARY